MRIIIGSDHRGVELKARIKSLLESMGHEVTDVGTDDPAARVDYTDYGFKVAHAVARGDYPRGVLVCSSGIGMSITANRCRGVRAALCHTEDDARLCRKHNNANILCLGQSSIPADRALEMVKIWLQTEFEGGRHQQRVDKLDAEEA